MGSMKKVAVVGCGKIAQARHIPELSEHPEVELVAICDADMARARSVAERCGIPRVFSDMRPLLEHAELDAVTICTPNVFHADMSLLALERGKHVLVEKPMATTREDGLSMVDAALRRNKVLLVGHNQRLHPVYRKAKEIVQFGAIGKVVQFTSNFQHGGPESWSVDGADSWFLQAKQAGFGVLGDLGIHKIDMIRWILEEQIEQIDGYRCSRRESADVEDNAVIMMRLTGGILGTVNLSWNNPLQDHRTVFYGEKGNLVFGESYDGLRVHLHSGEIIEERVEFKFRKNQGICSGVIDEFVRCVQEGSDRDSVLNGREAMRTMDAFFKLF